ncbi:methyl-accepting chemotaxis protein [Paraburkholderia phymatum]|uniref:Methyl-accepting chemotaxis sensory transducer n=1 Tax=Paraburkholderia phymatum (strain DSM 17167 / CIP 108236 / LMG 21445 / STM815) TaxID=391038 RepID=B2JT21_PARP8|nr:methyl-accepting chemotaxis protein [Paraburkholderia phymatum]ACC75724.1 methyl-accepting chemotaxis sensory transducer [Paraburkholderia phymatum STM815]
MAFLNTFKIGPRLGAGFATVLILLCATGGIGLLQASRIYDGTNEIASNWLPSVEALGALRSRVDDVRRLSLRELLAADANQLSATRAQHTSAVNAVASSLEVYSKLVSSPEEQRLFDSVKSSWSSYLEVDGKVTKLIDAGSGSAAEARQLTATEGATRFIATLDLIDRDIKLNHDGSAAEVAKAGEAFRSARMWTLLLAALALALGAWIAVVITRSITGPLRRSVEIAETVARGDLTAVIQVDGKDELSQLLDALRNMNERLLDTVARVRSSSESIATGSSEIAAGNTDLSQRTEEQAASLEETAASMEELTSTVKQNAENANQGNALAARASDTAARGGDVVSRVVDTMRDISNSSQQVAQIISVIEGIAFQTNILALNAAVEAARAGEQGRGFAVVAGEVRTLAQRSASAAKEIKDLIDESVNRVNSGTALVDEAGRTMGEIVQSVRQVSDLMGEISAASGEQHRGIEQVNVAISQMDEVTQQNAALVEEASAAAQSMASQASTLRELVSTFRLPATREARTTLGPSASKHVARAAVSLPTKPRSVTPARPQVIAAPKAEPAMSRAEADWETF